MRRGSFVTLRRKCGKPTCHCADGEGHPAKYLSLSEEGKTRLVYVGSAEELGVAETSGRYREFRGNRAELAKLSQQVLKLIDELEARLVIREPRPPRRRHRREKRSDS